MEAENHVNEAASGVITPANEIPTVQSDQPEAGVKPCGKKIVDENANAAESDTTQILDKNETDSAAQAECNQHKEVCATVPALEPAGEKHNEDAALTTDNKESQSQEKIIAEPVGDGAVKKSEEPAATNVNTEEASKDISATVSSIEAVPEKKEEEETDSTDARTADQQPTVSVEPAAEPAKNEEDTVTKVEQQPTQLSPSDAVTEAIIETLDKEQAKPEDSTVQRKDVNTTDLDEIILENAGLPSSSGTSGETDVSPTSEESTGESAKPSGEASTESTEEKTAAEESDP
jgi:hypothetical protein